ncbi:hypothetical protein HNP84_004204 [Thermocatellispora tengchongensis]|uniref:Uncharacterized protein n=1 Tax=Thermocatellispora tengchongensis TaxID=1073253 RepID=A0A840P548_9ACTN|nr:hypothetical protein [Thermocatellispora tengchongensis]
MKPTGLRSSPNHAPGGRPPSPTAAVPGGGRGWHNGWARTPGGGRPLPPQPGPTPPHRARPTHGDTAGTRRPRQDSRCVSGREGVCPFRRRRRRRREDSAFPHVPASASSRPETHPSPHPLPLTTREAAGVTPSHHGYTPRLRRRAGVRSVGADVHPPTTNTGPRLRLPAARGGRANRGGRVRPLRSRARGHTSDCLRREASVRSPGACPPSGEGAGRLAGFSTRPHPAWRPTRRPATPSHHPRGTWCRALPPPVCGHASGYQRQRASVRTVWALAHPASGKIHRCLTPRVGAGTRRAKGGLL